jgi:hypothetical protein
VTYRYADPSTILTPPSKKLSTDNPAVQFTLSEATFSRLGKVTSMLDLDLIVFSVNIVGDEKSVSVRAKDAKNPVSHVANVIVPSEDIVATHDFTADVNFKAEHIKMLMDGAYTVSLGKWPYGFFQHKSEPVSYFIVAQP